MDGERKALIVANDEYEHDGLQRLWSAAADADALAGVLGDPQVGGFTVEVARNRPAHDVGVQIEDLFSDSRPDDVLLLHFSCHGLKDESGELYFATRNTRPNRLGSTAISAAFVQRCMRASRSRSIVLLLDCCYGGAFSQGVTVRAAGEVNLLDSFPVGRLGGGRGRAVITASSSIEYAFEGDQLADAQGASPSVFTAALVEGLATGDADRDEDGWVSLNELYDYVFDKVRERNPHQTPSRDVEMQGELYLARSRRRRIRPMEVPPDLRAAMADPNMFARLGAVTELRARLTGDNLQAAAGAFAALTEIAGTDIRYVADAAQAALHEAAIQPDPPELHFGQATVDAEPEGRALRLLGPPVARACTPDPSDPWIRVAETADGFEVSVATSRAGSLAGHITLRGPTGEVTVPVEVQVTPAPATADPEPAPAGKTAADPAPKAERPPAVDAPAKAEPPAVEVPPAAVVAAPETTAAAPPPTRVEPTRVPPPFVRKLELMPPPPRDRPPGRRAFVPTSRTGAVVVGAVVLVVALATFLIVYNNMNGSEDSGGSASAPPSIRTVAFAPDGKMLATGSDDGFIRLWNPATGRPIGGGDLNAAPARITSIAFSPDGKLLASASTTLNTIRLWDVARKEPVGEPLTGHTGGFTSLAFSPKGEILASGSTDGTVGIWNVGTGKRIETSPAPAPVSPSASATFVNSVAFSPDGKVLVSGGTDELVRRWNPATGKPLGEPFKSGDLGSVVQVGFRPDGKWLVATSNTFRLQLFDTADDSTLIPNAENSFGIQAFAFSPNGKYFAGAFESAGIVRVWNPNEWGNELVQLTGHNGGINSLAFSPDSKLLAVGTGNNTVRLWNTDTGILAREIPTTATPSASPS